MKCPHCGHEFPMTWNRYLRAPFGRHTCPCCYKKSKFGRSKRYLMRFQVPFGAATALITLLLTVLLSGSLLAVPIAVCVSLIVALPVDRYVEDRLRELHPLEKERAGPQTDGRANSDFAPGAKSDNKGPARWFEETKGMN